MKINFNLALCQQVAIKYYLNFAARSREHSLRNASTEQLYTIIKLVSNNTDHKFFLIRTTDHARRLAKLKVLSKSDPESNTSLAHLIQRLFCQFDLGTGKKWSEFRSKHPKYNPLAYNWAKYISNAEKHQEDDEVETDNDETDEDPQHWSQQLFRDTITEDFGEPDDNHNHNSNNGSMSMNNSNNASNLPLQTSANNGVHTDQSGEPSPTPLIRQNP